MVGIVYLVGAGPGDKKLITVKGLECVKKADVILYDRLVNPLLLLEAKHDAEFIYCGKLPKRHILRQEQINHLLVENASKGKVVVRLKGGDPGVFGRVGEEAESLRNAKIPYEIVPGITSGIAAPLYAGIPVTHREYGGSFAIVTGHDQSKAGKPQIEWNALVNGIDTVAFYMGINNLSYICDNLIAHGKDANTGVAVIQWGTMDNQKVVVGSLETISTLVKDEGISNPAITLVGDIVLMRDKIKWFERDTTLKGKTVIMTSDDRKLKRRLVQAGAEVTVLPLYVLTPNEITVSVGHVMKQSSIAFGSKESVKIFFDSLVTNDVDLRTLKAQLFANDGHVQQALQERGLHSHLLSDRNQCVDLLLGEEAYCRKYRHLSNDTLITHRLATHQGVIHCLRRMVEEKSEIPFAFGSFESTKTFIEIVKEEHLRVEDLLVNEWLCIDQDSLLLLEENGFSLIQDNVEVEN